MALLVAFLLPLGAHAVADAQSGDRPASVRTYVVRAGDTLWSIAVSLAGPNEDPRPYVDGLQDENHLSGPIVPGERLLIP